MVKVVLFDLDGTLLPMDQEVFIKGYFKGISTKMAKFGYDSQKLVESIWTGTYAMIKNDGSKTNEKAFWEVAVSIFGQEILKDMPHFDDFYKNDFNEVQKVCGYTPKAKAVIDLVKEKGKRLVLATNPVFPKQATLNRIRWAGLNSEDFELITTYESSSFCKPNERYYQEIIQKIGVDAEHCLMVGNDVGEDMIAPKKLGMQVFLLTDCLINKTQNQVCEYPNGNFDDLIEYLNEVLSV